MSSVSIQGNASGTGIFTIASPNSSTNRTLTLPDATGTIITTAGGAAISGTTGSFSGDLSFNSGYGSAAVAYGCRAWVNFNGTGTPAIRASGNVSSITDNGTADYTINFTTAMPDANYCISGAQGVVVSGGAAGFFATNRIGTSGLVSTPTTSSCRVNTCNQGGSSANDAEFVYVSIFR